MMIDLEHLHYWMCAIRDSNDPKRTLDAFWKGQINSKLWLIENLRPFIKFPSSIEIHGGWVGVLASMIFQSKMPARYIFSIDIDDTCEPVATMMNKIEEQNGKFKAITCDMCDYSSNADIVINTSFEHISQTQYNTWVSKIPQDSLIVLQSNNYNISEHVRIANDLEEFKKQASLESILYEGELELPSYKRFMIIGKKYGTIS